MGMVFMISHVALGALRISIPPSLGGNCALIDSTWPAGSSIGTASTVGTEPRDTFSSHKRG
jgi:hypothetical protein